MKRIVVFTDEPFLAAGLASLLPQTGSFELLATCGTMEELWLTAGNADLALVDLTPAVNEQSLANLRAHAPKCQVVTWSRLALTKRVHSDFRKLGVRGTIIKTWPSLLQLQFLMLVAEGCLLPTQQQSDGRTNLEARDDEILRLVHTGCGQEAIRQTLKLKKSTFQLRLTLLLRRYHAVDLEDLRKKLTALSVVATTGEERRTRIRFPIEAKIALKTTGPEAFQTNGHTINIASGGFLAKLERPVEEGTGVEAAIEWPNPLDGTTPTKLVTRGSVLRTKGKVVAIWFGKEYEFYTRANHASTR